MNSLFPKMAFFQNRVLVLLTIPALFEDYHLIANFFTTISAIYLPPLIAYLFLYLFRQWIFADSGLLYHKSKFISSLAVFVPAVLAALFLVFWFPHSFFPEYIFSFVVSGSWWLIEAREHLNHTNENYMVTFRSLGADDHFISKNITWFEMLPGAFSKLPQFHLHLWGLVLSFEFFMNYYGLGAILRQTLLYHDLSALFLMTIIISLISAAGYAFIRAIDDKFIFWSAE